jgi:hypothetical protein
VIILAETKNIVWSKTFWVSVLVFLIGVLTAMKTLPLDAGTLKMVLIIVGLLGIVLRILTTGPVSIFPVPDVPDTTTDQETEKVLDDLDKEAGDDKEPPPTS